MARPKIRGASNDLTQVIPTDWARLAAFIDGEGHIAIQCNTRKNGRTYHYIRVIVSNTDPRLMSWLLNTFGGGLMTEKKRQVKLRTCYKWSVSCQHAENILLGCFEYFITKRQQAEIALAFQGTIRDYRRGSSIPQDVQVLRAQYRELLEQARWVKHAEIRRDSHGNVSEFLH